jgi:hypothetical protein
LPGDEQPEIGQRIAERRQLPIQDGGDRAVIARSSVISARVGPDVLFQNVDRMLVG